jgi:hypothetical protein
MKAQFFGTAMEQFDRLPPVGCSRLNREAWRKIKSELGKRAKKYALAKHPGRKETLVRATLAAEHLAKLIIQDVRLDKIGRRWCLEELYNLHSREQGGAEDASDGD